MNKKKIVVIGGGIHGITAALELASEHNDVTIIEKNADILLGTSAATHNRAHMGYHYPRSIETAEECIEGLNYFKGKYPESLYYPREAYYAIAKEGSYTSADNYITFCERMKIPYKIQWPLNKFLARENLDISILCEEPCFNLAGLYSSLRRGLSQKAVTVIVDAEVYRISWNASERYSISINHKGTKNLLKSDVVINATYTYANNILEMGRLPGDRTEYNYQTTEVVVVDSGGIDLPSLTVMDGPFISIMPNASDPGLFLLYDVKFSVIHSEKGKLFKDIKKSNSNWEKMKEHGGKYFPFIRSLKFVKSLWGSRPIPVSSTFDSRYTRIEANSSVPGFYSILEGKFISAPLVAQRLVQIIRKDGLIK